MYFLSLFSHVYEITNEIMDILTIPTIESNVAHFYRQIYKVLVMGEDILPMTTASLIGYQDPIGIASEAVISQLHLYKVFFRK